MNETPQTTKAWKEALDWLSANNKSPDIQHVNLAMLCKQMELSQNPVIAQLILKVDP
jgi:hypothetical protein